MALDFTTVIQSWEEIGVFDVVLPFLLIFTITFAILNKSGILGGKKNFDIVISIVASLLFVRNTYLVGLVNRFLPNVSLFMVVILMFLLLVGIFGGGSAWSGGLLGVAAIFSLIFVIYALSSDFISTNFGIPDYWTSISDEAKTTIVFLGIFIFLIWLVTKEEKKEKGGGLNKFLEWVGQGVKKS